MQSNLFMYLTAMSAISIHNLVNNINEATQNSNLIEMKTLDKNWTLDNETSFNLMFTQCNGSNQSPIQIETTKTKENPNLRLSLTAYDKPISGYLINEFPTFKFVPLGLIRPKPSAVISNSLARSFNPYADSHFVLQYVEFYWSPKASIGESRFRSSMHQIDESDYPLEIHFVHLNTAHQSIHEALTKPNGLLVLAVLVTPSTHESYIFDKILDELSNTTSHGQMTVIEEDSTWRGLLPSDTSKFYRYRGSMIWPPCHESVQWVIFGDKLKLGQKQLKRLNRYKFVSKNQSSGRDINWTSQRREFKPLNNRVVERSFSF